MRFEILCPAKVNLFLHILGKRADGYHILESLVTFADFGDVLSFEGSDEPLTLEIDGVYASELLGFAIDDNLIMRAARAVEREFDICVTGTFQLTKNLPIASGIGGGSANAAAAVKLLMQAYELDGSLDELLLSLGADVPVCYLGKNVIMSGIGEELNEWPDLSELHAVLVNPNEAVSTAEIFGKLNVGENVQLVETINQAVPDIVDFLKAQRNDMQVAAIEICPEIVNVLNMLSECEDILLARMSGSGATCFGLFRTAKQAEYAAKALTEIYPNWWIQATRFSG